MRAIGFLVVFISSFRVASAPAANKPVQFPNFQPVAGWGKLPDSIQLGLVSAVATDRDDNLYVLHRGKQPVVVFDREGKFLRSWDDDLLARPHGLRIDREGNLWVTDITKHVVVKFDAQGKRLLALGQKGKAGTDRDHFDKPTDVAVAPTGEFYVADGYGNSRVVKFSRDGKYLKEWGTKGTAAGEFNLPHAILLDAGGRVFVADRENKRVQIFDGDGKFLDQWRQTGAPYGMFLTKEGRLLVADALASWVLVLDGKGKPLGRWGEKGTSAGQFDTPHAVCVDSHGAVYVADLANRRVQKFVAK